MRFRPCIDIHGGRVKQIVGGSLKDMDSSGSIARENYVSDADADFYGRLYKEYNLKGGHIILLDKAGTKEYEEDLYQASLALKAYPLGLQIGGSVNACNAERMLDLGASHVIVTSYVFSDGRINYDNLEKLRSIVGKEHIVLDLSCRKRDSEYYVVTDRWQKFTDLVLNKECMYMLGEYCDEFLIHAVDMEGRQSGVDKELVTMLGDCNDIVTTYAGGISSDRDIRILESEGRGHVDFTIGSALDIFGGSISFEEIAKKY